jgi:hypothetical protein
MRFSPSLLIILAWAVASVATAQTAASQPTGVRPTEAHPAAAPERARTAAHHSRRMPSHHSPSRPAAAAGELERNPRSGGVLALGATDITGNKELPKVMAIVPWKDSPGAGGVVKPTDSLMDEVLAPVDRGVFQRQVRYYQQLNGSGPRAAAASGSGSRKP